MTLALRYAVRSDVGLLREGNEDSAYAGPHLLAVADGMGGYEAGEVASAAVISAVAPLDREQVLEPDLIDALADAVSTAKRHLRDIVTADPSVGSMGTTLTAMLWAGGTAAICHIGDSRAYLLRDNELYQITHDHTFVQALIDQGRIRPDEAATHPQRSLILRALDGRSDAEPDLSLLAAEPGDRYLLCSDGLPVAVSDDQIVTVLAEVKTPDEAVLQLIDLAIRGGGPDNITCIVADVFDPAASRVAATAAPVLAGAASAASVSTDTRPFGRAVPAASGRASGVGSLTTAGTVPADGSVSFGGAASAARSTGTPIKAANGRARGHARTRQDAGGPARTGRRRWPVITTMLGVLVLVVAGGLYVGYRYTQSQYYVGVNGGQVEIFRGINDSVLGVSLHSPNQATGIGLASVPYNMTPGVRNTTSPGSLGTAQKVIANIRAGIAQCRSEYNALARWVAASKPVKRRVRRHGRVVTITVVPNAGPKPAIQSFCPPEAKL